MQVNKSNSSNSSFLVLFLLVCFFFKISQIALWKTQLHPVLSSIFLCKQKMDFAHAPWPCQSSCELLWLASCCVSWCCFPAGCNWLQGADRSCSPACYQTDGQLGEHSGVTCLTRSRDKHSEWTWPVESAHKHTNTHWCEGTGRDFDLIGRWGESMLVVLMLVDQDLVMHYVTSLKRACTPVVGIRL